MTKPTLDERRKALQDERQAMSAGIKEFDKQIEYFDSRLANYRQGSKDIQSSISRLKNDFGRSFARHNIQDPEVKRQALLFAIEERRRIIAYQTNAHDFSANSPAVEAALTKQKFDKNPSSARAGVSINDDEDTQYTLEDDEEEAATVEDEATADVEDEDEDEEAAAAVEEGEGNGDEEDEDEDEDTLTQTASPTASTKPKTQSELLNEWAKESHDRQLAKMDELLDAVKNMDFSKKPDSEVFQAFVDSEIEQQELMLDQFKATIKKETKYDWMHDKDSMEVQRETLKTALHDAYDEILLELRDENLKTADELCRQQYEPTNHEDLPEVTKPWLLGRVYGSKDYREYSTDRDPANVIQYFSRLASTGMFNGMEFGEKSMSIDAEPTLRINEKGELELAENASEALKAAFNDQYPNGIGQPKAESSLDATLFPKDDAKKLDRHAGSKQAATERLKAKIQSLQDRQDALATKATDLQTQLDTIERFQTSKKTTTAGYQRPKSDRPLGKLKDDLDELKACKQELDAVKSFPRFSNKDLGMRAFAQKEQIKAAEKILQATQATTQLIPPTDELYASFLAAKKSGNKTQIKAAKDALETRCQDTLTALDENISKTEAKIKPLQAKYFEYQKLQRECKKEQQETRKEQINAAINDQIATHNENVSNNRLNLDDLSDAEIDNDGMAHVTVDIKVQINAPSTQKEIQKGIQTAVFDFYSALAKQPGVAPVIIYIKAFNERKNEYERQPFLTIDTKRQISCPRNLALPQHFQTLQQNINALQAAATATTAPPISAPLPPNTAAITENGNANMNNARIAAADFVTNYNQEHEGSEITVEDLDENNPSQFTLRADDEDKLRNGLLETLKYLSKKTPTQTFVGKIGNETFTYTNGKCTSTADTSPHDPLLADDENPENDEDAEFEDDDDEKDEDVLSEPDHSQPAVAQQQPFAYITPNTDRRFTFQEKGDIDCAVRSMQEKFTKRSPPVTISVTYNDSLVKVSVSDGGCLTEVMHNIGDILAANNPKTEYPAFNYEDKHVWTYSSTNQPAATSANAATLPQSAALSAQAPSAQLRTPPSTLHQPQQPLSAQSTTPPSNLESTQAPPTAAPTPPREAQLPTATTASNTVQPPPGNSREQTVRAELDYLRASATTKPVAPQLPPTSTGPKT